MKKLNGRKTYITAFLLALNALAQYYGFFGKAITLPQLIEQLTLAASVASLRHGIKTK